MNSFTVLMFGFNATVEELFKDRPHLLDYVSRPFRDKAIADIYEIDVRTPVLVIGRYCPVDLADLTPPDLKMNLPNNLKALARSIVVMMPNERGHLTREKSHVWKNAAPYSDEVLLSVNMLALEASPPIYTGTFRYAPPEV